MSKRFRVCAGEETENKGSSGDDAESHGDASRRSDFVGSSTIESVFYPELL